MLLIIGGLLGLVVVSMVFSGLTSRVNSLTKGAESFGNVLSTKVTPWLEAKAAEQAAKSNAKFQALMAANPPPRRK